MENFSNETIEPQTKVAVSEQPSRIFTDAFALQVADQVLSNVERVQLKTVAASFDLKKIRAMLIDFKSIQNEDSECRLEMEMQVLEELHFWRLSLARRDEIIKAFHLRRFYEQNQSSVSAQMLAGLGCFYRNLKPTFEVRSKYDFIVTQLFTSKSPGKPRFVKINSDELIIKLKKFNESWTGVGEELFESESFLKREEAVEIFSSLRREVNDYARLEDLLKNNFFNRVRRHKQYLGDTFFAPEVTAAAILCNVAVGNKFAQLVASENESFRKNFETEHGNGDLLNLILEENPEHLANLLKEIHPYSDESSAENDFQIEGISEKGETLISFEVWNKTETAQNSEKESEKQIIVENGELKRSEESVVTEIVVEKDFTADEISESLENAKNSDQTESATVNFLQILNEISKRQPEEYVLQAYLQSSSIPVVKTLELGHYLNEAKASADIENYLKRRALRLIFIAEENRRKLQIEPDSASLGEEIEALKNEIQTLSNQLRLTISALTGDNKKERANVLLIAANNLLEAKLRLIPASLKSTDSQIETRDDLIDSNNKVSEQAKHRQEVKPENKKNAPEIKRETQAGENKAKKTPVVNRKLLVATILVVLFGAVYGLVLFTGAPAETETVLNVDVKRIDVKTMPGGENLVIGRVSNNTMIGIVADNWKNVSEEKKREDLKALLQQGNQYEFKTILLFDSRGESVGRATQGGISVK